MREIKFRAWNGRAMEYGGFSIHATGKIEPMDALTSVTEESPIMQYTGLKDKNGVEIYEGDILRMPVDSLADNALDIVVEYGEHETPIGWYGRYIHRRNEHCHINSAISYTSRVIGNIHENPELLEAS